MKSGDVRMGTDGLGLYMLLDSREIGHAFWRVLVLEPNPNIEEDDCMTDDVRESWLKDYTKEFA